MSYEIPVFQSSMSAVFEQFAQKCMAELAPGSLPDYLIPLSAFDSYLKKINFVGRRISEEMIICWINGLTHLSTNTVLLRETALLKALRFATAYGYQFTMPERVKKVDDYQPYIFSEEEQQTICRIADNIQISKLSKNPWLRVEFPMITRILLACGTRITELLELRMKDVDLDTGVLTMRKAKGNKERLVPMESSLTEIMAAYCRCIGVLGNPEALVFPGKSQDTPLTYREYSGIFGRVLRKAGISVHRTSKYQRSVCAYCMRHTFACNSVIQLKAKGIHVDSLYPYLSTYMGHDSLFESEKYLKYTPDMVSDETKCFDKTLASIYECKVFTDDSEWL